MPVIESSSFGAPGAPEDVVGIIGVLPSKTTQAVTVSC